MLADAPVPRGPVRLDNLDDSVVVSDKTFPPWSPAPGSGSTYDLGKVIRRGTHGSPGVPYAMSASAAARGWTESTSVSMSTVAAYAARPSTQMQGVATGRTRRPHQQLPYT